MSFAEKIETKNGLLGIWKLDDSVSELTAQFRFTAHEKVEFAKIKNEKRKKEYLATRLLLNYLLSGKYEIEYLESGKPQLKNSKQNITISHSANFVALCISDRNIGIDIENTERNINNITGKFLHPNELKDIENTPDKQVSTVLYWSAKEALFKCTDDTGIQFNEQIIIQPFEIKKEGNFTATLNKTEQYNLWYSFYENNVIVICVK